MNEIEIPPETIQQHTLADSHPEYTMQQFQALKADIKANGQLVPITLYREKLVDGRHRLQAAVDLNLPTVRCVSLPNNLTLSQVKAKVLSTEVRRHQSPTQLAIKAYRLWKTSDINQNEALGTTGASGTNLKLVNNIVKFGRLDIIDLLERGGKFNTALGVNYERATDSLSAIVKYLKLVSESPGIEEFVSEETKEVAKPVVNNHLVEAMNTMAKGLSNDERRVVIANLYKAIDDE